MYYSSTVVAVALSALSTLTQAQNVPPPSPVLLTATQSGVLPVLPTNFNGTLTLQGAIIQKAPPNASYIPVNGPAQVQSNLPASSSFRATLPTVPFNNLTGTTILGSIVAYASSNGTGVTFAFNLTGLPDVATYGPFAYHIHDRPVPADGNCTSTLSHFDYTNAGEYYTCTVGSPQNCQIGDLSGKHGAIMATTFSRTFTDNYLSTDPSSPYYFGAKSITFHTRNTTRLTCANFVVASANGTTTGTATRPTTSITMSNDAAAANPKSIAGAATFGIAMMMGMLLF